MTPELKPKTPELKPKTPELKPKTLDLKLPKLKTKRRLRFWLRWRQTQEEKGFPDRKRLENEVPGLQKAPRERQIRLPEAPGSASGGARSAPRGLRGAQQGPREGSSGPPGTPWGRPERPGGFKHRKIKDKQTKAP